MASQAFALGGLAGNNAFGAGFLAAAADAGVRPDLISCTSGQIFWVAQYLNRAAGGPPLRQILAAAIDAVEVTKNRNLDVARLALLGVPGAFRPAYLEYSRDFVLNWLASARRIATHPASTFWLREALSTLPAQTLDPLFAESFFGDIAQAFTRSDIGIAFNSFSPAEGTEYVHLNDAARALYEAKSGRSGDYNPGQPSRHREHTVYADITPEAVRNGLWLYEYGFHGERHLLDGAYYRQVMLAELAPASRIFVARPVNQRWLGELPNNYVGVADLKTEVGFNGSYAGERHQIFLVNSLLDSGVLDPQKYHHIDLQEIEIEKQRDYLGYIFEDLDVFDDAYAISAERLAAVA